MARKKGLDNFYEKANGSPLPKKSEALIAPVRISVYVHILLRPSPHVPLFL